MASIQERGADISDDHIRDKIIKFTEEAQRQVVDKE
jgi:hypothetical protein